MNNRIKKKRAKANGTWVQTEAKATQTPIVSGGGEGKKNLPPRMVLNPATPHINTIVELTILGVGDERGNTQKILVEGPDYSGDGGEPWVRPEDSPIFPVVVGEVTKGEMDWMAAIANAMMQK